MSLTDPKVFGPGGWDRIHIDATRVKTKKDYKRFDEDVRFYASKIHCKDCRTHFLEHIESDLPLKRKTIINKENVDVTMFIWSVDAHNKVNKRLGKSEHPYEKAYEFYYKDEGCETNCGGVELPTGARSLLEKYKVEGIYEEIL